jgi:hypothetical protein
MNRAARKAVASDTRASLSKLAKEGDPTQLTTVIRDMVSNLLPPGFETSNEEFDALTQLLMMMPFSTGDEDPKELVRKLSDNLLKVLTEASSQPGMMRIFHQMFCVETMWRNSKLAEDWRWEWETENQGKIAWRPAFDSTIPPPPPIQ